MALGRIRSLDLLEAVSLSRLQEVEARLKYSNFLITSVQVFCTFLLVSRFLPNTVPLLGSRETYTLFPFLLVHCAMGRYLYLELGTTSFLLCESPVSVVLLVNGSPDIFYA
jgi:hypothetical protein